MILVKLKGNVRPRNLVILAAAVNAAIDMNIPELWVTSGNDSEHMKGSKHYTNNALDLRSKNFPTLESKKQFIEKISDRLGADYDCILEQVGKGNEHFHIEYDPKDDH